MGSSLVFAQPCFFSIHKLGANAVRHPRAALARHCASSAFFHNGGNAAACLVLSPNLSAPLIACDVCFVYIFQRGVSSAIGSFHAVESPRGNYWPAPNVFVILPSVALSYRVTPQLIMVRYAVCEPGLLDSDKLTYKHLFPQQAVL